MEIKNRTIQLIRKTATELPDDIFLALRSSYNVEKNPTGKEILFKIIKNCEKGIRLAAEGLS